MSKENEIKLILNTQEAMKDAKKFGADLSKALNIQSEIPAIKKYQELLRASLNDINRIDEKTGKITGGFDVKQLAKDEKELAKIVKTATELEKVNNQLGAKQATLPSLRGKIGGAKTPEDKELARNRYVNAKNEVDQLITKQQTLSTQLEGQLGTYKEIKNRVEEVAKFKTDEGNAVEKTLTTYEELVVKTAETAENEQQAADSAGQIAEGASDAVEATDQITSSVDSATAATETLADKMAEVSTGPSDETEGTIVSGASETSASLEDLMSAFVQAKATMQEYQRTGKDTAETEQQLADITAQISDRIGNVLNFDKSNASFDALLRHYQELLTISKMLEGAKWPAELSTQIAAVKADIVQTKQAISEYERSFKQAGASIGSITSTFRKVSSVARSVINSIKRGFSTIVGAANKVLSAVKGIVNIFKSGFSTIGKAIKKVSSAFNKMSGNMHGNLKHLITSLTKYVLGFRSLFFLVRRLRKYIGEGIKNMAQFNGGMNHVNSSITRLLSSLLYLKNAWATAFSPILQFVTPWLEALIDRLARVGNAFSRFLGSLLGQTTVFQAVKVKAADYADSLDNVGGSASGAADKTKKLTDRLAAFDDLNVLGVDKDPDKTGRGGGGGAGDKYEPNPNDMFTLVNVGKEALEKLKQMWEDADFSDLGATVSNKLISALQSINWTNIQATAYKIGKSVATFLAGAFNDTAIWSEAGNALAKAVNTLTQLVYGFFANDTTDWGGGLTNLIISFFQNVEWDRIVTDIKLFTDRLIQNINSFLSGMNGGGMSEGVSALSEGLTYFIANAITGIHWDELLPIFSTIGGALVNGIIAGLSGTDNPFLQAVSTLLGTLSSAFAQGDATIAADGLTQFFQSVFANISIDDLIATVRDFFGRLFSNLFSGMSVDPSSMFGELFTSFKMIGDTLLNVFSAVMTILPKLLPGILLITQASMDFINALLPIIEILLPPLNDLIAQITALIGAILVPVLQLLTPVITLIAGILELITPIVAMIVEFIQETFGSTSDLLGPLTELVQALLVPLGAILKPLMQIIKIILDLVADILSPIMELISPLIELLVECFRPISGILEIIGSFIDASLVPGFKIFADVIRVIIIPILKGLVLAFEFVANTMQSLGAGFTIIVELFKEGFNTVKTASVSFANFLASKIEWLINALIGGFNAAIRGLNKLSIDVPAGVPGIGGTKFGFNIKEISKVSIPRLAQGAVIPPNREFMAVLGDQSHGTNIEAPLDIIKQAVAEVMSNNGNAEVIQLLQDLIRVVESKNLTIGDKEIGKANARYVNQQRLIRGTNF